MQTTVPSAAEPLPADARGRLIGALVGGCFGSCWMLAAVSFAGANRAALAIVVPAAAAMIAWPVARLFSLRRRPAPGREGRGRPGLPKAYWIVVAIEWTACAVAVNWLVHIRRFDLVPQAIGLIVGIHFVPLAKIFRAPIYHWTAAAMVLGVLVSLSMPRGDASAAVSCAACGLALWITETVTLWRIGHHHIP